MCTIHTFVYFHLTLYKGLFSYSWPKRKKSIYEQKIKHITMGKSSPRRLQQVLLANNSSSCTEYIYSEGLTIAKITTVMYFAHQEQYLILPPNIFYCMLFSRSKY